MKTKLCTILCLALAIGETSAQVSHKGGHCPMRNTVSKCTPSCVSDHQCSFNEKCCPNKCSGMSCVSPSPVSTGNDGGYKGSSRDNVVYCAGRKCGPYEICKFDRASKREKCGRP